MDHDFNKFVDQHSSWHRHDQSHECRPGAFPNEKADGEKESETDPFGRSELAKHAQQLDQRPSQVGMKPSGNSLIGANKRV
jgi:hypothetical protein